ncbi:MAG TPA: FAD-linked oxidase C-terminal domain-containing protein [Bacteroidales bacterium]|nr:FAD-linked oxidase C-terminal domain-containing protein [Bacteroidales bacterium]
MKPIPVILKKLADDLEGDLKYDAITRTIYATDASIYREFPAAVAWPRNSSDIKKILRFATENRIHVTVRAAGTSLAGQVVSSGIIADISRYMNKIIEINPEERYAVVEPGVVLDELNREVKKYGLMFGPETSTANRCNVGGMFGNNGCGLHSLAHGSTRDHTLEAAVILSDGSEALFGPLNRKQFEEKCREDSLEGKIYRNINEILSDSRNADEILREYPGKSVPRRNTGYALDMLLDSDIFTPGSTRKFNFCNLLSGSEGTLAVATKLKLNLISLPPENKALVCIHLKERNDAFRANLVALKFNPQAVEMMDDRILELTKENISQRKNRFFLEGDPGSILIVEFARETGTGLEEAISKMIAEMKEQGFGYAYPVVKGGDIAKVWDLRKAGLGVLSNMKGDPKPVTLIEDTSIGVDVLPGYMEELERILSSHGKECVYHAHIGTGELHVRPILNLKDPGDVALFRTIGREIALLVKKYHGSLSGEHGDGRLRGEFIPLMLGENIYRLLTEVKSCWDPENILNPGKITSTPPMDSSLRYTPGREIKQPATYLSFSSTDGIIRAAENCNGSGDCRKSSLIGGLMCPSFMATRDEKNTTRARANVLREFMSRGGEDPWNHKEVYEILDLCLSCKGCKSECPSNVDIAKLKAEYLQHWYDIHGVPLRSWLVAWFPGINMLGSYLPSVFNFFATNRLLSGVVKRMAGFATQRSIPTVKRTTLRRWIRLNSQLLKPEVVKGRLCLFIDEFTNYNDTEAGIAAIKLFTSLGYEVVVTGHEVSGRTFISKGLIRKAGRIARKNIAIFSGIINEDLPLVGIEPSAILGFRDEYPDLAGPGLEEKAIKLARNCLLADEFIVREFRKGNISKSSFTDQPLELLFHTHCQQKAVASSASLSEALGIPVNFRIREIPSGCCGMAGSFGYEKEHYDLSNKIGELVLFPEVRKSGENVIITAPGTSCRHHIKDGTGRKAIHPVEVLYEALKK